MLVEQSGIGEDVVAARGYFSATKKSELKALGFPASQQNVPTLVCPVYSVCGDIRHYQHRPDTPRMVNGKTVKYETLAGKTMVVDVHPSIRDRMGDPSVPVIITEGIKKADAAISAGLYCLALLGVYSWRGTNVDGGKTALPDWESIALNDRLVYLCFDSDVMEKKEVYSALQRFKAFLEQRGANVQIIYLPHGNGGKKIGLDDFLAGGGTREELLALAVSTLRPLAQTEADINCPYRKTSEGLIFLKEGAQGSYSISLTNFTAAIVGEIEEDDGADKSRVFSIEAQRNGRRYAFTVPAEQFFAIRRWAVLNIGAGAVVYPGMSCEANAATAIQLLSGDIPEAKVYKHTGWRELESGVHSYLSAGSVIGASQPDTVSVQLSSPLDRYALPEPPTDAARVHAIQASLQMLQLGPDILTIPIFAAIYRAVCGPSDFALFLVGESGVFKSEVAALAQQHFGISMNARNLPASWEATENYLEGVAFAAKDALIVIDDYAPRGGHQDQARLSGKADRVLRAQGNNSARGRLNANLTTRSPRPPRGLIFSTAEDVPPGNSLRARNFILEVSKGDIDAEKLTPCQSDADAGFYASCLSGYLEWFAPRHEALQVRRRERVRELRAKAAKEGASHARTPEIVANLAVGLEFFLEFAEAVKAISSPERAALEKRAWTALLAVAREQGQHHAASDPVQRYLELLRSALASGDAHIAAPNGLEPEIANAWGWRVRTVGTGEFERDEWVAQGRRIGWLNGESVYLEPQAAYGIAKVLGERSNDGIAIGQKTLHGRLKERGLLVAYEEKRGSVVRREVEGRRLYVLELNADTLNSTETAQSALLDNRNGSGNVIPREIPDVGQFLGADAMPNAPENCPQELPKALQIAMCSDTVGQDGQFGQSPERSKEIPNVPNWEAADREEYEL